jgi:hypothetical protein
MLISLQVAIARPKVAGGDRRPPRRDNYHSRCVVGLASGTFRLFCVFLLFVSLDAEISIAPATIARVVVAVAVSFPATEVGSTPISATPVLCLHCVHRLNACCAALQITGLFYRRFWFRPEGRCSKGLQVLLLMAHR